MIPISCTPSIYKAVLQIFYLQLSWEVSNIFHELTGLCWSDNVLFLNYFFVRYSSVRMDRIDCDLSKACVLVEVVSEIYHMTCVDSFQIIFNSNSHSKTRK